MERRSRSIESSRRFKSRKEHGRRGRSRSPSRNRSRERRRRTYSRSRSRERLYGRQSGERDLYKDLITQDYQEDRERHRRLRDDRRDDRDIMSRRDRGRDRYNNSTRHRRLSSDYEDISDDYESEGPAYDHYCNQPPSSIIILQGLAKHITEQDISYDLSQHQLVPLSIRLVRKRSTGASRGFAFVEFSTEGEAIRWMEHKQGILMLQGQYQCTMQYSHPKEPSRDRFVTDWYCAKCGVFNFKRRKNCFTCHASREESEKGGEGSDEVSQVLTKKIMLRNLDVLTNEEGVLTAMQELISAHVSKISKILICRDPLTSTSRGICYLTFDNLVDSMNTHNALKDIPLKIDHREVLINYCMDGENGKQANKNLPQNLASDTNTTSGAAPSSYTLADVPRLAEYSATMYASTPAEHDHYFKYYTQYYVSEITNGHYANLPTLNQLGSSANSGAAVALSAIQRKQKHTRIEAAASSSFPAIDPLSVPKGNDGKKYPQPDVSLYQYDETSGYYYDPMTGLYYDAHSQYYYNSETGAYLYWDPQKTTYLLAPTTVSQPVVLESSAAISAEPELEPPAPPVISKPAADDKKETARKDGKQDKVKVAKKIVKDMEKWAKQLNQKKEMNFMTALPPPNPPGREYEAPKPPSISGYADVGFSILEKKEKGKLDISTNVIVKNNLMPTYGSDSDEHEESNQIYSETLSEKEYVNFEKLTCLLCKRAFPSSEVLQKHLKMSTLHKENLQKYSLERGNLSAVQSQAYRDRAKERRLKYGESDPPPTNRGKERFERDIKSVLNAVQPNLASVPIGENNVGNRLLQKMGWSEGQGLGRSNQGRTNIIETGSRSSTAGLGSKHSQFGPGDDYKSYIKRMMKARYDQAN